jgi:hypothetical protein
VRGQSVEVGLNDAAIGSFALNDGRFRYRIELPAGAQRVGDNRLRFRFAAVASPAAIDPASTDRRELAAAFYGLAVGDGGDLGLEDLLTPDAPRPFEVSETRGLPTLTLVGPTVVRFAIRLPPSGELRFTPVLHAGARAAATGATFRVLYQEAGGEERDLWSRALLPREAAVEEQKLRLPGRAGDIVRVGLALGFRVPKIGAFPAETWAGADRPDVYAELDKKVTPALGTGRNWRSSMGQDVTKRRRTEIEQMNGHVVAKGREAGVPTPVSEIVVDIVRGIDAGTREPAPATIDETLRRVGQFSHHSGYQWCLDLLAAEPRPTAVFAANDVIAFGALDAARRVGVRVPAELSIVGFDDIDMAGWEGFNLTTVRQPLAEMGRAASKLLIERIDSESELPPRRRVFPVGVVHRDTLAVAPAS